MTALTTTPRPRDEASLVQKLAQYLFEEVHGVGGWHSATGTQRGQFAFSAIRLVNDLLRPILDANDALHRRIAEVEDIVEQYRRSALEVEEAQSRATAAEARAARDAAEIERLRAGLSNLISAANDASTPRSTHGLEIALAAARQLIAEGDRNAEHG